MANCLAVFSLYVCLATAVSDVAKPPHIVFIVADDLGWNDVGWQNPEMYTPNIDKLAKEGVILNSSYVQPVCTPSRSAFMTGYFPFHTGMQHKHISEEYAYGVPLNLTFLPQRLRALGYDTHIVGKWHLGYCNWNYTPTYRGFDSFYGHYNGNEDYYTHRLCKGLDLRYNEMPVRDQDGTYSAYLFAKRAIDVIEQHNSSRPLYLYLPFQSVHAPLQVPKKYEEKYRHINDWQRRIHCAMVTAMDEAIGKITKALVEKGLMDETLLVFTTDNGGSLENMANNWPLRGGKCTVWEGGTKGAAFVWGNLLRKKKYVNTRMIHAVDWFPTFVALAGGEPEQGIDGLDQWKTISDDAPSARTEFVYNIDELDGLSAIRSGDFKYMEGNIPCPCGWVPPPTYRTTSGDDDSAGTRKCNQEYSKKKMHLFNITADPLERNDLSNELPDVVRAMKKKVNEYIASLHPAFPPVPDPKADPKHWGGVWSPGWC